MTQIEALGDTVNNRARIRSASQNKDVVMNRLFSAALLSCAAASLSNPAWSFQGFDFFEQIEQSIECVRKPGTDMLVCSNKFVPADDEDEETIPEPAVEPTPEAEGRQYFSDPVEITIPEENFPAINLIAPAREHMGPPNTNLGSIEVADFDQNGVPDIAMTLYWSKGRNFTDPERCGQEHSSQCWTDYVDHDEEQWNESWTTNLIVLQQESGEWEVGNRELFGEDTPTFGLRGRKTQVGDFNGDGYPDYYRAGSWEDGRASERWDPENWESPANWGSAPQKVMISNGDGTYRMEDLGIKIYGHGGTAALMQNGQWHAIHGTGRIENRYYWEPDLAEKHGGYRLAEGHLPAQVRTWYNGVMEEVEGYPYLSNWETRASEPEEIDGVTYSRYLIHTHDKIGFTKQEPGWCDYRGAERCAQESVSYEHSNFKEFGGEGHRYGFEIFEQVNSEWVYLSEFVWGTEAETVEMYNNGGDPDRPMDEREIWNLPAIDMGDYWGVQVTAADGCSMKLDPEGEPIFIFGMDGQQIPKSDPQPYDPRDYSGHTYTYLAVGMVDGELTELDIWPEGNQSNSRRVFHCDDINGDGYDDLYAPMGWNWGHTHDAPEFVVWLNDQNGNLIKTEVKSDYSEDFLIDINYERTLGPDSEYYGEGFHTTHQVVRDVNADGIGDLVQYTTDIPRGADESEYPKLIINYGVAPQKVAGP